jgi:hypothetical protein
MAVIFKQGDTPTKWDLRIYIRDDKDRLFDPYLITYAFYYISDKGKNRIGMPERTPIKESTGYYFVGEKFNTAFLRGDYYVEWSIKRDATAPIEIARQEFAIVS